MTQSSADKWAARRPPRKTLYGRSAPMFPNLMSLIYANDSRRRDGPPGSSSLTDRRACSWQRCRAHPLLVDRVRLAQVRDETERASAVHD